MDKQRKTGLVALVVGVIIVLTTFFWDSIPGWLVTLVVVIGVGIGLFRFGQTEVGKSAFTKLKSWGENNLPKLKEKGVNMFSNTRNRLAEADSKKDKPKRIGFYFNVVQWNIFVRTPLSIVAGWVVVKLFESLFDWTFGFSIMNDMNIETYWAVVLLVSVYFFQSEGKEGEETVVVPETTYVILSFWGMRIPFYLKEGNYSWTGKKLGLSISRDQDKGSEGVDSNTNISAFGVPMQIWNSAKQTESEIPVLQLEAYASNTARVKANVTLNYRFVEAIKWLNSKGPVLLLADAARHATRTSIGFFKDTDAHVLESAFQKLLMGDTLLIAYKTDGSVLRNRAGHPVYSHFTPFPDDMKEEEKEQSLIELINQFKSKLQQEGSEEDLKDWVEKGKSDVHIKSVWGIMSPVLDELGIELLNVLVADAQPSEEVQTQANRASGEDYQLRGQIKSAEAFKKSAKIRQEAVKGVSDLVQAITAAEDNPDAISVVFTAGGGGDFTQAAATHASISNKKGGGKS